MAGLCSGLTEAIVINPFEVVKVKLQAERNVALSEVCIQCKNLLHGKMKAMYIMQVYKGCSLFDIWII